MRIFAVSLLLCAAGCNVDLARVLFGTYPQGAECGDGGLCPPDQQCVPGELICRVYCTTQADCQNPDSGGTLLCDVDGYCRPACGGAQNSGGCTNACNGNGNNSGNNCDVTWNTCRQPCKAGACPSGWSCIAPTGCSVCRPPPNAANAMPDISVPLDMSVTFSSPDLSFEFCGAPTQQCCAFHQCENAGCCVPTIAGGEVCVAANSKDCPDGTTCNFGSCGNGTCGANGQACCESTYCTAPYADCLNGNCLQCGNSGGLCCPIGIQVGDCQNGGACMSNGSSDSTCP